MNFAEMIPHQRALVLTGDGSHTVVENGAALSYHSMHGAIQESQYVFVETGLREATRRFPEGVLRVFEVGFGTGLNALLSAIAADRMRRKLHYIALEKFPLEAAVVERLNYPALLGSQEFFSALHYAPWEEPVAVSSFFLLEKHCRDLLDFSPLPGIQLIYFDAFAPDAQPELWTQAVFEKLFCAANPQCVLSTYCSKSVVRHAMEAAGWQIEKLPGPHGKREIVRASRP